MLETIVKTYNNFPLFQSRLSRFFSGPPLYREKLGDVAVNIAKKMAVPIVLEQVSNLTLRLERPDESMVSADKPSSAPTPSVK